MFSCSSAVSNQKHTTRNHGAHPTDAFGMRDACFRCLHRDKTRACRVPRPGMSLVTTGTSRFGIQGPRLAPAAARVQKPQTSSGLQA